MKDRITVQEAARRLGVKDDAIRKRIQRGTLEYDKEPDGRVFVYLDAAYDGASDTSKDSTIHTSQDSWQDATQDASQDVSYALLVEVLRQELEDWKAVVQTRDEELRRKDHIIAALTERIPEIEGPRKGSGEPPEASVTASEASGDGEEGRADQEKPEERPWWRRIFQG